MEEKLRRKSDSKRNAVLAWILAGGFAVSTLVLGVFLLGAKQKMLLLEEDMAVKMREAQEMAAASAVAAEMRSKTVEGKESIRLYNGQVQVCENDVWIDICSIEEFRQSDPIEIGRQKMRDIVSANQEAFANGTLDPKATTMFALYAEDGKEEIKPTAVTVAAKSKASAQVGGNKKPSSDSSSQAGNTAAADNGAGSAVTVQNDSGDSGSSDSYDDDNDNDSSDSGNSGSAPDTGGDSGNTGGDSGDTGGDSGNTGGDSGGAEEDSGDGENIGWTDEVL